MMIFVESSRLGPFPSSPSDDEKVRQYFKDESFYVADVEQRGHCVDSTDVDTANFICDPFSPSAATVKVRVRITEPYSTPTFSIALKGNGCSRCFSEHPENSWLMIHAMIEIDIAQVLHGSIPNGEKNPCHSMEDCS